MKQQESIKDKRYGLFTSQVYAAIMLSLIMIALDFGFILTFYKGAFPKIEDASGVLYFFFISLHALLGWVWIGVADGFRSPIVHDNHKKIRIRLVERRPLASATVACSLGAALIFLVAFSTSGMGVSPSIVNAAGLGLLLTLVGIVWVARWMPIRAGQEDLIFYKESNTVQLPCTFGRKQKCLVELNRLQIGINPSLRSWDHGDFFVLEVVANINKDDGVPIVEVLAVLQSSRQAERFAKAIRNNIQACSSLDNSALKPRDDSCFDY